MTDLTLTDDGIDLTNDHMDISDLRGEDHLEVVAETDAQVVFRDHAGYELAEFASDMDVERSELSERMHAIARQVYDGDGSGDPWSVSDPVVIAKL